MGIKLSDAELKQAAEEGEKAASEALSVMSKLNVMVSTQKQRVLEGEPAKNAMGQVEAGTVSAYTQAITGLEGTSVLTMDRKDALNLVDLFNGRTPGTTVVMNELDRSTVKETLNILSNSYIVELAKLKGVSILLSVPRMVTKNGFQNVVGSATVDSAQVLLFETLLAVEGTDFSIQLSFFFLTGEDNK